MTIAKGLLASILTLCTAAPAVAGTGPMVLHGVINFYGSITNPSCTVDSSSHYQNMNLHCPTMDVLGHHRETIKTSAGSLIQKRGINIRQLPVQGAPENELGIVLVEYL